MNAQKAIIEIVAHLTSGKDPHDDETDKHNPSRKSYWSQ